MEALLFEYCFQGFLSNCSHNPAGKQSLYVRLSIHRNHLSTNQNIPRVSLAHKNFRFLLGLKPLHCSIAHRQDFRILGKVISRGYHLQTFAGRTVVDIDEKQVLLLPDGLHPSLENKNTRLTTLILCTASTNTKALTCTDICFPTRWLHVSASFTELLTTFSEE